MNGVEDQSHCPHCHQQVAAELFGLSTRCSHCGARLSPPRLGLAPLAESLESCCEPAMPSSSLTQRERRNLVIGFWVLIFATPFSALLLAVASEPMTQILPNWISALLPAWLRYLVCASACAAGAAYCLSKLQDVELPWYYVAVRTLSLLLLIFFLFLALIVGGCLVLGALA
jgi:hypothetical protein